MGYLTAQRPQVTESGINKNPEVAPLGPAEFPIRGTGHPPG